MSDLFMPKVNGFEIQKTDKNNYVVNDKRANTSNVMNKAQYDAFIKEQKDLHNVKYSTGSNILKGVAVGTVLLTLVEVVTGKISPKKSKLKKIAKYRAENKFVKRKELKLSELIRVAKENVPEPIEGQSIVVYKLKPKDCKKYRAGENSVLMALYNSKTEQVDKMIKTFDSKTMSQDVIECFGDKPMIILE